MARVTVTWKRTEVYRSTIEIPDDDLLEYQKDAGVPEEQWGQFDPEIVKDFMEADDPGDFLEANSNDWLDVEGVEVQEVEL